MKTLLTLISVLALTVCLNAQGLINVNPDPNGEPWFAGGLRELTANDYSQIAATPKLALTASQRSRDLPSNLDNSAYPWFRPVFNQDGGSCGQASGIGYNFTYEMDYVRDLEANTTQNQYPTHYTWNFLNGGAGGGSWYFDGWQIIAANGIPNVETYGGTPWYGGDRRWMSGYDDYISGMENRMLDISTIDVSNEDGLLTLKQWMYDRLDGSSTGGLANFSAGVSDVFTMAYLPAGTPNAGKQVITRWGEQVNHAMTFIGYDDEICYDVNNDGQYTNNLDITGDGAVDLRDWEIGGLLMMNSWGNSFGNSGKAYVMYRTLALNLQEGGIWNNLLHVIRTRADYEPQVTLKATIKHTSRQKIKITAGVSANTADTKPAHVLEFPMFSNQGGDYYMQGGFSENDKSIEIGLDVTPLLSYIQPGQQSRFFIQIEEQDPENSSTGQITSLSLWDLKRSMEFQSQLTNVSMVNNDTTLVWADGNIDFVPTEISTQQLPVAQAGAPYSYQLEATGAQAPYTWSVLQEFTESNHQAAFPAITTNQLVPTSNDDGFATQTIGFPFPFYGQNYQDLVITSDGSIAFEGQFEYIRSEAAIKTARVITPYGSDLMIYPEENDGMFYEGDANHATFRWKISKFDDPSFNNDFAVTLYPDGTITFHYGNGITSSNDWAAGISAGDGQNYLISGISGSTVIMPGSSFLYQCPQLPDGMALSSDGIFAGTPSQPNGEWEITFRALSANSLFATRTLSFMTESELSELLVEPDSLIFDGDLQAYEGLSFEITNTTDHDVVLTAFDYNGNIVLQDGEWFWETWFWDPMPRTMFPGEVIQVVVSFVQPVFLQPMAGFALDTLNFSTETENYEVLLMFNDTINIYNDVKQNPGRNKGLSISPNPSNGTTTLNFEADESGKADLMIYSSMGTLLKSESFSGLVQGPNSHQIDISGLSQGIYIVKLSSVKQTCSARLVVR
ncbi:MAG: T9SS type A sorting domain-containing protein [Bacteroidales bacterium]|nr:T9SS type A sorting domain-containing protein [Bacteroidales bacterium]